MYIHICIYNIYIYMYIYLADANDFKTNTYSHSLIVIL